MSGFAATVAVVEPAAVNVSSAAENTRCAACRYAGITSTVVPRTSTGSPVFGSRISANNCSALSTFVQSTSSFVASELIHGVLVWYVLYVVPFHL